MSTQNEYAGSGKNTSGSTTSNWLDISTGRQYLPLISNHQTDTIIVGGGLAGLSVAYTLITRGHKVVVLEDGFLASGESGRTTAHLSSALDERFYSLEKLFGKEKTSLIYQSHHQAINYIEEIVKTEKIDCDFKRVDGYLFAHVNDTTDNLEKEYNAALRAGALVEWTVNIPGMILQPVKAIRFREQGQFHPVKYMLALAEAITVKGGSIFTSTRVETLDETGVTTTDGFRVNANNIVVATNSPFVSKYLLPLMQYPYRTYAIAALITKNSLPSALWWDTGDMEADKDTPPYHYVRTQPYNSEYDLLITGGEDHKTGVMDDFSELDRFARLENWARNRFEMGEVVYKWSGQVQEPYDGMAFIGRNVNDKGNVYVVTGDSGHGMTHSTIAAMLIPDLIEGKENLRADIYKPGRLNLKALRIFLKEIGSTLSGYFSKKVELPGAERISELALDDAAIIEIGGQKAGAYRDTRGKLHIVSATCTHMGCTVAWNTIEKTWDCPCHGSRFTIKGEILNGPANEPLDFINEDAT